VGVQRNIAETIVTCQPPSHEAKAHFIQTVSDYIF
jgi:hypothetical protein